MPLVAFLFLSLAQPGLPQEFATPQLQPSTQTQVSGRRPDMSILTGLPMDESRLGSVYCHDRGACDAFTCFVFSGSGAVRPAPPKGRQGSRPTASVPSLYKTHGIFCGRPMPTVCGKCVRAVALGNRKRWQALLGRVLAPTSRKQVTPVTVAVMQSQSRRVTSIWSHTVADTQNH